MADVDLRGADRGQLFLVGALALAVLFISVAFLLNTAIYTENLATRSDGASATDAIGYRSATEAHAAHSLEYVNHHYNTSHTNESTHFTRNLNYWSNTSARHQAMSGRVAHTELTDTTHGARIQQDKWRKFTPAQDTDDPDWALVNDTRVRNFRMNQTQGDLKIVTVIDDIDSAFHVNLTDSTGETWSVYVYRPNITASVSGRANVTVKNGNRDIVGSCTVTDDRVTVNITNRSFDGQPCEPLHALANLQPPLDISYHNANDYSNGTYTFVVDKERSDITNVNHRFYDDADSNSPYTTPALYDAKLKLVYRSSDTYYRATVRVAPGEIHVE